MLELINKALFIAQNEDVSTCSDCVVLYSISFMPNEKNKLLAQEYLRQNINAKILDDTPCGKSLIALGLNGKVNEVGEEINKVWRIASKRFIEQASGNITAFVEGADERSTFYTTELKEILENDKILTINKIDKFEFYKKFTPYRY